VYRQSVLGASTLVVAVPTAIMTVKLAAVLSVSYSELNLLTITNTLQAPPL
jgi:hypothetical protein